MSVTGGFIDQCEQEPLHLSGAIQPHGALLVADAQGQVTHASENLDQWLAPPEQLIGKPLPDPLATLSAELDDQPGSRITRINAELAGHSASVVLTRSSNGAVVIELLPTSTDTSTGAPMPVLPFTELNHPLQIDDARQRLVEHIQAHTGFDRVLYYLFRHDETGEVVAEACGTETTGTYHGLRFPASDIPRIARDLYMKSPWRTIPDAQAASINILGRGETPPDLSHADLRSVSPVHQSYMANMGVAGAVSIPVKTATRLKALISCHSAAPRNLTLPELKALADQVFTFNLRLRELLTSRRMSLLDRMEKRFQSWHNQVVQAGSLDDAWPELAQQLCEEFQADGVWLAVENRAYQFGTVPDTEAMELIEDWLSTRQDPNDIVLSQGVTHDCPHPVLSPMTARTRC
ncbi:GAF domain-containing protein [Marinobacter bryozoorum]|uniref:GAF domain-containing protein n=1 Tax=Marinobacter bryozoorum TaxID=256324 RepID=UPI00249DC692|nr:GAF domain-containing protein [Marinobacter bryozoorum]